MINSLAVSGYQPPNPTYSSLPRGGYADALSYFGPWYLSGVQPPIYRDRIYYAYRGCAWGNIYKTPPTLPAFGFTWVNQPGGVGTSPPDDVYATVFLTAHDAGMSPSLTLTITVGGVNTIYGPTALTAQITHVAASFGAYTGQAVLTVSGSGSPMATGPVILGARNDAEEYCGVSP